MPRLLSINLKNSRKIHQKTVSNRTKKLSSERLRWILLIGLIVSAVFTAAIAVHKDELNVGNFAGSLSTELFGAVMTFIAIDIFINRVEKAEVSEARKNTRVQQLIHDMGSQVNTIALQAAEELRREGWLTDGSLQGDELLQYGAIDGVNVGGVELRQCNLQGSDLNNAKLKNADLEYAQLQHADLIGANLIGASLYGANLSKAQLIGTYLQGATLWYATLQGAKLLFADLKGVDLRETFLQGTNFEGANLEGAKLTNPKQVSDRHIGFDEHTIMPDGSAWTLETDLARFTDCEHPNFWRSDDPHSPAYRNGDHEAFNGWRIFPS